MSKRFLLGHGERLTSNLHPPAMKPEKSHPYDNVDELYERLRPQIQTMTSFVSALPVKYCPHDESVFCIDLHPAYLSKSYFPTRLLNKLSLRSVGSRLIRLTPDKWNKKGAPTESPTLELFVAGNKKDIENIQEKLTSEDLLEDFRKIERIRVISPGERVKGEIIQATAFEIVVHAKSYYGDYVIAGLSQLAAEYDLQMYSDRRIYAGELCFVPMVGRAENLLQIEPYSFLRVVRAMPKMRNLLPACRTLGPSRKIELNIAPPPVSPAAKVAVFDGGCFVPPKLKDWVHAYQWKGQHLLPGGKEHGSQVNSALLFGPIDPNQKELSPFSSVDHYSVLCQGDGKEDPFELYNVLERIKYVLSERDYEFINLSIGPDLPIDDDEVHSWTAVLDSFLSTGNQLLTVAVGNNGDMNRELGNARIQVPSDSVNALSVGASSAPGNMTSWDRAYYSAWGPGRSPGKIKPDLLAFGGVTENPFITLLPNADDQIVGTMGTSFAAPNALRMGIGLKVNFQELTPLSIKALLVHRACRKSDDFHDLEAFGRGCIPSDIDDYVVCKDGEVTILYQGQLEPGKYLKAPIPIEADALEGMVTLTATLCFSSAVDSKDPANYTKSGLEVRFRPKITATAGKKDTSRPNTKTFFDSNDYATESELRRESLKWETVLHGEKSMRASSFQKPFFEIHYMARSGGAASTAGDMIPYALLITVKAPKVPLLYENVAKVYQNILQPLEQAIELPIEI